MAVTRRSYVLEFLQFLIKIRWFLFLNEQFYAKIMDIFHKSAKSKTFFCIWQLATFFQSSNLTRAEKCRSLWRENSKKSSIFSIGNVNFVAQSIVCLFIFSLFATRLMCYLRQLPVLSLDRFGIHCYLSLHFL